MDALYSLFLFIFVFLTGFITGILFLAMKYWNDDDTFFDGVTSYFKPEGYDDEGH